ncbi:MAG: hypothetical protein WDO13_02820 [Verrucomicrobiota bacterium]
MLESIDDVAGQRHRGRGTGRRRRGGGRDDECQQAEGAVAVEVLRPRGVLVNAHVDGDVAREGAFPREVELRGYVAGRALEIQAAEHAVERGQGQHGQHRDDREHSKEFQQR